MITSRRVYFFDPAIRASRYATGYASSTDVIETPSDMRTDFQKRARYVSLVRKNRQCSSER